MDLYNQDMQARNSSHVHIDAEAAEKDGVPAETRLCEFFDLLLRIDKRNNPRLYESNKSRVDSNKA